MSVVTSLEISSLFRAKLEAASVCLAFQEFLNHFHNSFSSHTWVTTKHRKYYLKARQIVASFGSEGSRKHAEPCLSHCGRTAEGICRRHLAFPSLTEQLLVASAFFCLDASSISGKLWISWAQRIFNFSLSHTAGLAVIAATSWFISASHPVVRPGCCSDLLAQLVGVPSCPLAPLGAFPQAHVNLAP